MPSRSVILNNVRRALRVSTLRPPEPSKKEVFQPIPPHELVPRFQKELEALKGEFHPSKDWADARAWVNQLIKENGFSKVVASPHSDVQEAVRGVTGILCPLADGELNFSSLLCSLSPVPSFLGVTSCDCLVACTGSVVLTARSGFGRALSILPPAHLVIAKRSQLVAHLSDAYALLKTTYGSGQRPRLEAGNFQPSNYPSMLTIISGPSRTSDIEKILVLGAHGPQKLFVLLLDF